jgi:hypothetical protein
MRGSTAFGTGLDRVFVVVGSNKSRLRRLAQGPAATAIIARAVPVRPCPPAHIVSTRLRSARPHWLTTMNETLCNGTNPNPKPADIAAVSAKYP